MTTSEKDGNNTASDKDEEDKDEFDDDYEALSVVYLQVFEGKSIVPALILAIRCVSMHLPKKPRRIPGHNASVAGVCALATAAAVVWKDIPTNLSLSIISISRVSIPKSSIFGTVLGADLRVGYFWLAI